MRRVSKKESLNVRQWIENKVIDDIHKELRDKYTFVIKLVGSGKWDTIIKDNEGKWDLDYQIILTSNSVEYKKNELSYATIIKQDFYNYFVKRLTNKKVYKIENSTTAITIRNLPQKFSVDFVIIKLLPDNNQIIRRNMKKDSSALECTWNKLPKYNVAYKIFNSLTGKEREDLIENHIIPRKIKEKSKNDNNPTKRSSMEVFIEEVNNYEYRRKNN